MIWSQKRKIAEVTVLREKPPWGQRQSHRKSTMKKQLDMAGRRTDIGSGRVYCDPKPDPIKIGFGCLKTDPT